MTDDAVDPGRGDDGLSRRRVLGGSASLGMLAALAGCIDDENLDEFLDEGDDDDGDEDRRRDEEADDDGDAEPTPEPDDPPESVAGGFDLAAAFDRTRQAIGAEPFVLSGYLTEFDGPVSEEAVDDSRALESRGNPADQRGRFRAGEATDRDLGDTGPEAAEFRTDVLISDGAFTLREDSPRSDEPQYDRNAGEYGGFTDEIDRIIEDYHTAGDDLGFQFDDPEWDESAGVYRVEATRATAEEVTGVPACSLSIDADGAVVDLDVHVEAEFGRLRTEGSAQFDTPVSVPDPDWLDEAEAAVDEPDDEPDDPDDDSAAETVRDATGQAVAVVAVGAGADGLAFDPTRLRIDPGTTVVWEWTGEGGTHNVVSLDGEFNSQLVNEAGHTFEHQFTDPGVYEYICEPHVGVDMTGEIEVVDN